MGLFVFEKGLLTKMKDRLSQFHLHAATSGHLCFIHSQPRITDLNLGLVYHLSHVPTVSHAGRLGGVLRCSAYSCLGASPFDAWKGPCDTIVSKELAFSLGYRCLFSKS